MLAPPRTSGETEATGGGRLEAGGPWAAQGRGSRTGCSTSAHVFNPTTVLGTPGPPRLPSQGVHFSLSLPLW